MANRLKPSIPMDSTSSPTIEEITAELVGACQQLLECPDLNLDELEDYTIASIIRAEDAILAAQSLGIGRTRC